MVDISGLRVPIAMPLIQRALKRELKSAARAAGAELHCAGAVMYFDFEGSAEDVKKRRRILGVLQKAHNLAGIKFSFDPVPEPKEETGLEGETETEKKEEEETLI